MSDPGAEPRLVVPEGLVIDESTRERLTRQLDDAPPSVAGIAAETVDLEPGASHRVQVEWAGLDAPWSSASAPVTGPRSVAGAVLLRAHVEYALRDGRVEVTDGTVLVDPGTVVHDPNRVTGPLLPASERGRSPFPRRPLVLFLACEEFSASDADRVRRLLNRLLRRDVEARLAAPASFAAEGVWLARPCLAGAESVRALAPDIVVTLDGTASDAVDAWLTGNRSAVVVAYDPTLSDPMELVSWQIGHAAGRLRARIGPLVDVTAFASLAIRLCAGPQPEPPAAEPELLHVRVREHWNTDAPADRPAGCVLITGAPDAADGARVEGFVDGFEGAGLSVLTAALPAPVPAAARTAELVVLAGAGPSADVRALIETRRAAGLPTAFDLGAADVDSRHDGEQGYTLTESAAELAAACGLVVAVPGARSDAARASGARVITVPTLLTRARAAALYALRRPIDPAAPRVVGWRLSQPGADPSPYAAAVADGVTQYLAESRDAVEVVGDAAQLPAALRGHERVSVVPHSKFAVDTIGGWAVHLWTPGLVAGSVLDDARVLEEASCAGVPSVLPAAACTGIDGFVSPHVQVEDVEDPARWYDALHHVLDDPGVRARRAEEASRRAAALDAAAASKSVVTRLVGWAAHRPVVPA